jgi:hypothetical protein
MVNIEEIEDSFKRDIEKIDKDFVENISNKKGQDLEKDYRKKLMLIRQKYEKEYSRAMGEQRNIILKNKNNKKDKKEKIIRENKKKEIETKPNNKYEMFKFKARIRVKDFIYKKPQIYLIIVYIKLKLNLKKDSEFLQKIYNNILTKIKLSINNLIKKSKEKIDIVINLVKKLISKIIEGIKKLLSKIKIKKQGAATESKKTEDQEIAEKLLNKAKNK